VSGPALFISTDLARATLVHDAGAEPHDAPPSLARNHDDGRSPIELGRDRLDALVQSITASPSLRRRLSALVVDVGEAECRWLRTTSTAPALVASKLRQQMEEWSGVFPVGGVQPLEDANADRRDASERAPAITSEHGVAVIVAPDALVRLLLDRLDAVGVRVDAVVTLWHALVASTAAGLAAGDRPDDADVRAVVLLTAGERVVWAWARGESLLAAGRFAAPDAPTSPAEPAADADRDAHDSDAIARPAARRLALEWAAWSAQLGAAPSRIDVLGPERDPLAEGVYALLVEQAQLDAEQSSDAAAADVRRAPLDRHQVCAAAARAAAAGSLNRLGSRGGMVRLMHRPTRATRRRVVTAALVMLLLAVALAGLGFSLHRTSDAYRQQALADRTALETALTERVGSLNLLPGQTPIPPLQQIAAEAEQAADFNPPPEPRPILLAFAQVFDVLAQPAYTDVQLQQVTVQQAVSGNRLTLVNVAPGQETLLINAFEQSEGPIDWEAVRGSRLGGGAVSLEGTWDE